MDIMLKQDKLPTALFAGSDEIAVGAVKCILDKGMRIPEDISIIGFNDSMASQINPPISTMRVDKEEMGRVATQMMIDLVRGNTTKAKVNMIVPKLVKRGTVKKVK